jgi:tetratricopeptide (TPR) repeat protein
MTNILISYTSSDRDWAFWIGWQLQSLGHTPHIHEWEMSGGSDIMAWMEDRHSEADQVVCVVSNNYLKQPYSSWERRAAQWAAASKRSSFLLPVFIEACDAPTLFAHLKRCDLYGLNENEARIRLADFLAPASRPSKALSFPGTKSPNSISFPGERHAISNLPISVPREFLGRDDLLKAIKDALASESGRVAITTLHGLRGVGKTMLAAAFAERHRSDYRAIWWIRAQVQSTIRADLIALGVRLLWVATDEKEEPAISAVMERLRHEGDGLLLIFDNALDADAIRPYLPRGGGAQVLVTSTSPAWRGIAVPVQIGTWPKEIGADYLIARTGNVRERASAEALSEELGGLPLAHEQAAAYCDRLGISLTQYRERLNSAPDRILDNVRDAPAEYHNRMSVAKTFALAIDAASELHPAAESLIVHSAFLAPEPIPLFLFAEARDTFGEPLTSALVGDGLDEAVASLRAFALIELETIVDERNQAISTGAIRIHRLVGQIAQARRTGTERDRTLSALISALAEVYPPDVGFDPDSWPRARRLDAPTLAMVGGEAVIPPGAEEAAIYLLHGLASYRLNVLGVYSQARPLVERALSICESALGPEHPSTATSLNNLAMLLQQHGDLTAARSLFGRALAIDERVFGPDHPRTATTLNNLAALLQQEGNPEEARSLIERALAISEKTLGPEHPSTAMSLNNLAALLRDQDDYSAARPLLERALAINERVFGREHPNTATSLNNLGSLCQRQGDSEAARSLFEQALAIDEKMLGPAHPRTAASLNNLAALLRDQGDLSAARFLLDRALSIREQSLGVEHPATAETLRNLAKVLESQGNIAEARLLYERALAIYEKISGSDSPAIRATLRDLAHLLEIQGNDTGSPAERRFAIERLTKSARDEVTRDVLTNVITRDNDAGNRCFIIMKLVEIWPDERTRDLLLDLVEHDVSSDVKVLACECLSRTWWQHVGSRQLLRSRIKYEANEDAKERLKRAVETAGVQVSKYWEKMLVGERSTVEEPQMLPGYPAFKVVQFRLRDIGPIRDSGVVELNRSVNIFLGDNAAGKTTLLRTLALAAIGSSAANEVEDNATAYLRKGASLGTIEVLFELLPDPESFAAEAGYFAVGLQIAAGSSRFTAIPNLEMSLSRPNASPAVLSNSAEFLGSLRSSRSTQFGFVSGYGAVRTFNDNRFSIQPEMQKRENEWVQSLFRSDAWLVNPEVFAKLIRGDTSNVEGAPPTALSPLLTKALRNGLGHLFPEVKAFFSEGDADLQINGTDLRFGELSEGYRSLLALLGHMLRCALKACDWVHDPTQLVGITLVDELDLHLHPLWQGHVVQDFRRAFPNLQLIASTHSPLMVGSLERGDVLVMTHDDDGHTTVHRPELHPQGLGVSGILTNIFDLGSTIDQPTLDKINRRLLLHSMKDNWNEQQRQEYKELTDHLAQLGFSREFSDPYFERFAIAMAKRHRAGVGRLTADERLALDEYADQLLATIVAEV